MALAASCYVLRCVCSAMYIIRAHARVFHFLVLFSIVYHLFLSVIGFAAFLEVVFFFVYGSFQL